MANILIIEDEKAVQENIVDILELSGYNVVVANNGKQGFVLTKTIKPDLIITDLMMPILDGFEFIRQVKQDKYLSQIPIIIISAKNTGEEIDFKNNYGVADYIKKPFNNNDLLLKVKKNIYKQ